MCVFPCVFCSLPWKEGQEKHYGSLANTSGPSATCPKSQIGGPDTIWSPSPFLAIGENEGCVKPPHCSLDWYANYSYFLHQNFIDPNLRLFAVYYVCFDDEHQSIVDIHCEPGMVLKIEEAGYGRSRWGMCRDLIKVRPLRICSPVQNFTPCTHTPEHVRVHSDDAIPFQLNSSTHSHILKSFVQTMHACSPLVVFHRPPGTTSATP